MSDVTADQVTAILNKPYARKLTPDEAGGYVVTVLEMPGCIGEGDTPEEALQNFNQVAASWIEASLHYGREIKEPIDYEGYSGKIALRIPRSLHQQVAEYSELEGVSINQIIGNALSCYCGEAKQLKRFSEVVRRFESLIYGTQDFFQFPEVALGSVRAKITQPDHLRDFVPFPVAAQVADRGLIRVDMGSRK